MHIPDINFNLRKAEELERYKRNGTIFSIAFIDMDHYKYINDRYGHQTGDHVLKELVSYIAANIRKCDSVYRYGGEEFVILMPDTSDEQAYMVIERLRQGFGIESISVGGLTLNVTFSAGIRQVSDKSKALTRS
jgi:diguanylate cyclase (GGDEF)-like protein